MKPCQSNQSPLPTPETPTHHANGERPERMREWLVRMINSGRFPGLEWLDQEKMIFRVPWVHAKKRDYNQERDAALFKEWAMHSGKYSIVYCVFNVLFAYSIGAACELVLASHTCTVVQVFLNALLVLTMFM